RQAHGSDHKSTITSTHAKSTHVRETFERIQRFFDALKANAPQLTSMECWCRILTEAMKKYLRGVLLRLPDDQYLTE
ncbi:MAG: hypothetical protein ACJA2O_003469, partial [Candidatus Azotimanducaceae bacterium]